MLASYKALREKAWKCLEILLSHRTVIKWINITHNRQTPALSKWCVNYFLMQRTKREVEDKQQLREGKESRRPRRDECVVLVLSPPPACVSVCGQCWVTLLWCWGLLVPFQQMTDCAPLLCVAPHRSAAHQRAARLPGSDCCSPGLRRGAHWCFSFIQKQLAAHNPTLWWEKIPTIPHTGAVV